MICQLFICQRAFVAERTELVDQQKKKWEATMQLRRDKEVQVFFHKN